MRLVHGLIKLVLTAALIAAGIILYLHPVSELYGIFVQEVSLQDNDLIRRIGGISLAIIAFLAFIPRLPRRRRAKEVSFTGTHGEVTIQLDHVESTLERVVTKLPEVKSIALRVRPLEGRGHVQVIASAVLMKDAEAEALQVTARVNGYIQLHTRKLLGLQDVDVRLRVRRFLVNIRSIKPEPLLLEAPQEEKPVPPAESPRAKTEDRAPLNREEDPPSPESSWAGGDPARPTPTTE